MSVWDDLVAVALMGTGQARLASPSSSGTTPLELLLTKLEDQPVEQRTLAAASVLSTWRRAGMRPLEFPATPAQAPAEDRSPCPEAAAGHLARILQDETIMPVLPEWLAALAAAAHNLPHRWLPEILDLACRQPDLRPPIRPVLGPRDAMERLGLRQMLAQPERLASIEPDIHIDQSGSMAASVVYAGILSSVLASLRAIHTRVIAFDTSVVDLSDLLADPVELLFGTQLGGGTDIDQALAYCQSLIRSPHDTILVLLSDLYEGGDQGAMVGRIRTMVDMSVQVIALLALNDRGTPSYNHPLASALSSMGVPAFGCTPDQFPDLIAAAIQRQDLTSWATRSGIAPAT